MCDCSQPLSDISADGSTTSWVILAWNNFTRKLLGSQVMWNNSDLMWNDSPGCIVVWNILFWNYSGLN